MSKIRSLVKLARKLRVQKSKKRKKLVPGTGYERTILANPAASLLLDKYDFFAVLVEAQMIPGKNWTDHSDPMIIVWSHLTY